MTGTAAVVVYWSPSDLRITIGIAAGAISVILSIAVAIGVYFRRTTIDARADVEAAHADTDVQVAAATHELGLLLSDAEYSVERSRLAADSSESRRVAAMAAFAGAAGRMQAMTTSTLAELREMENRHSDAEVLADLLQLDHRTAQAGRLADSIAVLSGARSGRRWAKPIAMQSILRGAMGRVAGYQRVRMRAVANIAIAGHAAESVMHALAELIDNACNFSPPTTDVHLYAAEVPAGVVITIEDSGLVMGESALRRAEAAVSADAPGGNQGADLSSLSGTRLGLAVVGHIARKHGLTVSFRPSAIGGTAVVVVVPRDLTTRIDISEPEPPISVPAPQAVAARPATVSAPDPNDLELPKRRRGSTFAAVHPEGLGAHARPAPAAFVAARADSLAAFQRAVNGRRSSVPAPSAGLENER
ncbi:sensor histidine kinase [Aldersonia kunmingensis]|uniref:sensor histidine kinase n=1 Tax=Aldersonia kunmingensis TaxID=408066 RepID=UPI000A96F1FD|nr:ATP-binding protein [Aldersonia kunmingensis]